MPLKWFLPFTSPDKIRKHFVPSMCVFHAANLVLFNLKTLAVSDEQFKLYRSLPHVDSSFPFTSLSHHCFLLTYFHPYLCLTHIFTVFHHSFFIRSVPRITKKDLASSYLSVRIEQPCSQWMNFHQIWVEDFSKISRENWTVIKIRQHLQVLDIKTCIYLWYHLAEFLLEWQTFQTKMYNNQNRHFTFKKFLPKIVPVIRKCYAAGIVHRWQHTKAQEFRKLDY
jgi:hypothetical protein